MIGNLPFTGKLTARKITPPGPGLRWQIANYLRWSFIKALGGSLAPTGTLALSTRKALTGTLTTAGTVAKRTARVLAGALAIAGDVVGAIVTESAIVDYLIRVGLVPRTAGQKPVQLVGQKERRTKGNDNPA